MDNGPARTENFATKVQQAGEELGDMLEISTLRREDYDFIKSEWKMIYRRHKPDVKVYRFCLHSRAHFL